MNQTIWRRQAPADRERESSSFRKDENPDAKTVLVVDDDRTFRRAVSHMIKAYRPGVTVFEAGNGARAFDRLAEIRVRYFGDPSLMVLDLEMPVMSGWEVIRRLKKEYTSRGEACGIPLLVCSGTGGVEGRWINPLNIHESKSQYVPLVSVSKEAIIDPRPYDDCGPDGLLRWVDYFLTRT